MTIRISIWLFSHWAELLWCWHEEKWRTDSGVSRPERYGLRFSGRPTKHGSELGQLLFPGGIGHGDVIKERHMEYETAERVLVDQIEQSGMKENGVVLDYALSADEMALAEQAQQSPASPGK